MFFWRYFQCDCLRDMSWCYYDDDNDGATCRHLTASRKSKGLPLVFFAHPTTNKQTGNMNKRKDTLMMRKKKGALNFSVWSVQARLASCEETVTRHTTVTSITQARIQSFLLFCRKRNDMVLQKKECKMQKYKKVSVGIIKKTQLKNPTFYLKIFYFCNFS